MSEIEITIENTDELWKTVDWCRQQFGPKAPSLGLVGNGYTWGYLSGLYKTVFCFAHVKDHNWFVLRWS